MLFKGCLELISLWLFHAHTHTASREASVRFNSRGITGYIRFTELENGSIQIVANLQGLRGEWAHVIEYCFYVGQSYHYYGLLICIHQCNAGADLRNCFDQAILWPFQTNQKRSIIIFRVDFRKGGGSSPAWSYLCLLCIPDNALLGLSISIVICYVYAHNRFS